MDISAFSILNPLDTGSDGDSIDDGIEVANGSDPDDPNSLPDVPLPSLVHRYSFNPTGGTEVLDELGGANGEVLGEGFMWDGSQLLLDGGGAGAAAYVDLPNGLISGLADANGGSGAFTDSPSGPWLELDDVLASDGESTSYATTDIPAGIKVRIDRVRDVSPLGVIRAADGRVRLPRGPGPAPDRAVPRPSLVAAGAPFFRIEFSRRAGWEGIPSSIPGPSAARKPLGRESNFLEVRGMIG